MRHCVYILLCAVLFFRTLYCLFKIWIYIVFNRLFDSGPDIQIRGFEFVANLAQLLFLHKRLVYWKFATKSEFRILIGKTDHPPRFLPAELVFGTFLSIIDLLYRFFRLLFCWSEAVGKVIKTRS